MRRTMIRQVSVPGIPATPGFDPQGNWVSLFGTNPATQTQSAAAEVPLAAVAVRLKYSNTVRVNCDWSFGGNTNTELITLNLRVIPVVATTAAVFALAGTGTISTANVAASLDTTQDSNNRAHFGAVLTNDAAGVLANTFTFNGASLIAGTIVKTKTAEVITGVLQAGQLEFGYNGLVDDTTNFVPGNWAVLALTLTSTAAGGTVAFSKGILGLQEQALGAR